MESLWVRALGYLIAVAAAHFGTRVVARWARRYAAEDREEEGHDVLVGVFRLTRLWERLAVAARWVPWVLWTSFALYVISLIPALAELRAQLLGYAAVAGDVLMQIYTRPLLDVGATAISIQLFVTLLLALAFAILIAGLVRRFVRRRILGRTQIDIGIQHAVATGIAYVIIFFGFLVALETVGIDLSTFTVIAGALSIGVGFGLQHVANNFISGLIILAERPIKVGDRIQVGDIHGRVVQIKTRATTVRTNDNIFIIVPNSEFVSGRVINWAHADHLVRFRIPVGVAYGSDLELVEQALLEAAREVPEVLRHPEPGVRFVGFGASSVDTELLVWTREGLHRRGYIGSQVNRAIYGRFMEYGIEIPFPQQDLHVREAVQLAAIRTDGGEFSLAPAGEAPGAGKSEADAARRSRSEVAAEAEELPEPPQSSETR